MNFRFDKWLADEMEKQEMDVRDLSIETGLNELTIARYIKGAAPTLNCMEKILDARGKDLQIVDK